MKAATEVIRNCLFIVPEIVVFALSIKHKSLTNGKIIYCFGMQNTRFALKYAKLNINDLELCSACL